MGELSEKICSSASNRAKRIILDPLNGMLDDQVTDIVTTFGACAIREVMGKFQRTITFTTGVNYADHWMGEALMAIVSEYNNISSKPHLEMRNKNGFDDGSTLHYALDDGTHSIKYRNWHILLNIQTKTNTSINGRSSTIRVYTLICYDLSPEFVKCFEKDMLAHRNSILQINKDSPMVNVYADYHEQDGFTVWEKEQAIPKRSIHSIYLPDEQMKLLVNTINGWFSAKKQYRRHGIPWNLKILLYGPAGSGKDSIARMIASHWHRNIYMCTGGKNGRFIPNAITSTVGVVVDPLFIISDIDKYPALINEQSIDIEKDGAKEEVVANKQTFNNMINALDGVLSGEGRIVVMTTNHIEKFSDTFLRPGRIDLKMEIGYVTPDVFVRYVHDFYNVDIPGKVKLKRSNLTIAEFQADILFYKLPANEFIDKYATIE